MNRGTWQATVHRVTKSQTHLSTHTKLYCKLEFQDVLSHPKPLLLEKAMGYPTLVLLPGDSHGRRSLVGYSPWGR